MDSKRSGYLSAAPAAVPRPAAAARAGSWVFLSYVLIGLAALLPRVLDLGAYLNVDEAMFWLGRSDRFLKALQSGDYAATAISTHPGVTTMWLGAAGLILRDWLLDGGLIVAPSFSTLLALTRLPLVLTHTAGVLLGYGLLRRMLPATTAALAALLWAADPFVIGYSRILHVDGLMTTFATLSLLAACVYWHHGRRPALLVVSGVCAGLAILSKSPGLALLPAVGLIALLSATNDPGSRTKDANNGSPLVLGLWSLVLPLLIWGAIMAITIVALWPALWVGSLRPFEQLRLGVEAEGAGTHVGGNFFMGREIDRPGLLFYPVALGLRLTPWTLLGLLALPLAWRRAPSPTRRDMAALAAFAVLFIIAMSVFPNKLNRYLVPVFPALDTLAALGVLGLGYWLLDWLGSRSGNQRLKSRMTAALAPVVALAAIVNAAWWHPYGDVAFNQVFGGARAGARTFFFGTGEGMQLVAAWLNRQPDITGVVTVSPMTHTLQPYLVRGAQATNPLDGILPRKSGYVVVYGRHSQREELVAPFDQFYGREEPLHVVTIHGVDYAWIYQVPPPVGQARLADFGPAVRLRGLTADGAPRRGQTLALKLSWEAREAAPIDYMLFAHLLGPDDQPYARVDLAYPTSSWQPRRYVTTELPIAIPADAPAGTYRLAIGLYDPASGQRLPLVAADALDPAVDGPDALLLAQFELE